MEFPGHVAIERCVFLMIPLMHEVNMMDREEKQEDSTVNHTQALK